jgi:peptide/nickel transport system ATP-binding protein
MDDQALTAGEARITTAPGSAGSGANGQEAYLSVRDLRTYFFADEGVTRAVDGASFDLYPGRTLGIVGESGCGKSVTARSILRIVERPGRIVSGQILLRRGRTDGRSPEVDLAQLPADGAEIRQIRGGEISLIFQEPMTSFSPVHTVGNQLIEMIRLHTRLSKREARARAIELLRMVGIPRPEGRIDEYAYQLSGGLRQRAMIARARPPDPKLLIADEPTTALDVTTQAQILDLLRELQARNHMAIMLITHDLGVIAEMADDVVVMYLGRVVEEGPVDSIFHAPKHPYTQALLRSMPSIESEPRLRLPVISGSIPHPFNRPPGCPFVPRCPSAIPGTCDAAVPAMTIVGENQAVSCYLYGERSEPEAPSLDPVRR